MNTREMTFVGRLCAVAVRLVALGATIVAAAYAQPGEPTVSIGGAAPPPVLLPTSHPPIPTDRSAVWLAPQKGQSAIDLSRIDAFVRGVKLLESEDYAKALPILSQPSLQTGVLSDYAAYFAAIANLRLDKAMLAREQFQAIQARKPVGYLQEAAAFGEAEAEEALEQYDAAIATYERLLNGKPVAIDEVLMRLGRAAKAAGQTVRAGEAFSRVYYEFTLGALAGDAYTELTALNLLVPVEPGTQRYKFELGRAERLFAARRYADAKPAYALIRGSASGEDRELVTLRLAETDYYLRRQRAARDALKPLINRGSHRAEAMYFYALANRDLDRAEFVRATKQLVRDFPEESWAEEALNTLGTDYIVRDEDDEADKVFRELFEKFPQGRTADRAAWKVGWRAYRAGNFADAIKYFEAGAARFPRSDYRPSWLYWAARAHEALNERALADHRYSLATTDYGNSYYGRLASKRLGTRVVAASAAASTAGQSAAPSVPAVPPNSDIVRALTAAGLYDLALEELRYALRMWGESPVVQATMAYIYREKGQALKGTEQFTLFRSSINSMKRAYPQYLSSAATDLPADVLRIIFPLEYWETIQSYSAQHKLDPYLMAALVAQESTFVPDIRSSAKAVGLMQLMPATARQVARSLKIPYSSRLLTSPESNIRLGMAYFAAKLREFGDVHLALASYNAGERAVRTWMAERPGLERDEFIDDIPYPETQGYVKKILGTADDYRRLYGPGSASVSAAGVVPASRAVAPAVKRSAPARKSKSK